MRRLTLCTFLLLYSAVIDLVIAPGNCGGVCSFGSCNVASGLCVCPIGLSSSTCSVGDVDVVYALSGYGGDVSRLFAIDLVTTSLLEIGNTGMHFCLFRIICLSFFL